MRHGWRRSGRPTGWRKAATLVTAFAVCACTEPQRIQTTHHWNTRESTLFDAQVSEDGLQVVRRTAVRTALEDYVADGTVSRRAYTDNPITAVLAVGSTTYFAEEITPARNRIVRLDADGEKNIVSEDGNWTQIVEGPGGEVFGVESLFLSRDVPPSACRIFSLTKGKLIFEDNFSYHYPFGFDALLLLSPLDRRVRILENGKPREIGAVTSMDYPPLVSHDRRHAIWFGPSATGGAGAAGGTGAAGSTLYLCDAKGNVSAMLPSLTERPVAWLGNDVIIGYQDALTTRWILKRTGISDGLVKASIPVPANVILSSMKGSPRGDFIGLASDRGSILIRVADGFIQDLDVALSAWRFSRDGDRLWLVAQGDLQVIDLK